MAYEPDDFTDAINSFKVKFGLDASFDLKKDPYLVIAYYQAISVRKIELALQDLITEVKTTNSKLESIKNQMNTNASSIVTAIEEFDIHG